MNRAQIKIFFLFAVLFSVLCSLFSFCWGQLISSSELINRAKDYDGKTVTYAGEAVGELMRRGDYAWVNLHDGQNALGIWLKADLASQIIYYTSYKYKGDRIEVTGVFQRACLQHGGDLDIHAASLQRLSSGRRVSQRLNPDKKNQAFILGALLLLVWILRLLIKS
jgi:hypothetical protein